MFLTFEQSLMFFVQIQKTGSGSGSAKMNTDPQPCSYCCIRSSLYGVYAEILIIFGTVCTAKQEVALSRQHRAGLSNILYCNYWGDVRSSRCAIQYTPALLENYYSYILINNYNKSTVLTQNKIIKSYENVLL